MPIILTVAGGRLMARIVEVIARLQRKDRYRPELHYMRGPGPKWRARAQATQQGAAESPTATARSQNG